MKKYAAVGLFILIMVLAIVVSAAAVAYALPKRTFTLVGVSRITVVGNNIRSAREVLKLAGFPDQPTAQRLSPRLMNAALRNDRFVRRSSITRKGDAVLVMVSEARPYFRMVFGGQRYWLCRDGEAIVMDVLGDKGRLFDELRKRVTVRLAAPQMLEDPQMLAQGVYVAMRIEEMLPMQFAEMRVGLDGKYQLLMRNGLAIQLGGPETEGLEANLAVLDKAIRAARGMGKPIKEIDFRDSTHVVVTVVG